MLADPGLFVFAQSRGEPPHTSPDRAFGRESANREAKQYKGEKGQEKRAFGKL